MNVLYLTFESIEMQPILESQVLPLLENISKSGSKVDLLTLENESFRYEFHNGEINHIKIIKKAFFLVVINMIYSIYINRDKYDIIHVRSYIPMFFILLLKPFITSKIIFDMRGVLPEEFLLRSKSPEYSGYKYKAYSIIFKFFEKYFLKISDNIVVVSNAFNKYLLNEYSFLQSNDIYVIPTYSNNVSFGNGQYIDCKLKYFNNKDIELYVYSGSLEVWQNFDDVIRVFDGISRENESARLIVFTRDIVSANNQLLKSIDPNLIEVHSLTYSELILSLPSCDFGFLLRDKNLVNEVSSPIKFCDYVNANVFVIASDDIGDVSNYIKTYDIGVIIENLDKNKITSEAHRLVIKSEEDTLKHFDDVKKVFSLNAVSKSYLSLYGNIVR